MKRLSVACMFALSCSFAPLHAQSPYKMLGETDGYLVAGGVGLTLAGYVADGYVQIPTIAQVGALSRSSVNSIDRYATYQYSKSAGTASDVLLYTATAAPFLLFTGEIMRNDWRIITLMYLEAWSCAAGATLLTKGLTERYRPYAYNPNVPLGDKLSSDTRMSFFSGHTSTTFASAVFLATVYNDYHPGSKWVPYVWAGSLLTAGAVGVLRYEAGQHFPSDIVVGAIVGSACGYLVPWLHRVEKEDFSLAPGMPGAKYGFSMQWTF